MSIVTTRELVDTAIRRGSAVAAVNVITLEHAEAIAMAAASARTAVIMQISQNAVAFHAGQVAPIAAATAAVAELSPVDIALHLDHVTGLDLVKQAASRGFSSVMVDGAALTYDDNVAFTRDAAELARAAGLWVEAELGYVGGKPDAPRSAHAAGVRTDPDEAAEFVGATGVDALAVAVGSTHAMTSRDAELDVALIRRLRDVLPVPLVLHGSSGVPLDGLHRAVEAGIRKVNVGTALNVAMTGAIRRTLDADAQLVDPRKYLAPARDDVARAVGAILDVVSSSSKETR